MQKIISVSNPSNSDFKFSATNMGGFTAALLLTYNYKGESFQFSSGNFTLFFSRQIKIPREATDVHAYAVIGNGLGQWTPVFNNNYLNASGDIDLVLYGTIWSPQATITADPNLTNAKISVKNNGGFIARYSINYILNNLKYTMDSENFSVGMTRDIAIPKGSTNISVVGEYYNGIEWIVLYNNNIPTVSNIYLTFDGTTSQPTYTEKITPPAVGGVGNIIQKPLIIMAKKSNKTWSKVNDTITFTVHISNSGNTVAKNVILKDTLLKGMNLITESITANGITVQDLEDIDISTFGLHLGDIKDGTSLLLTYKVKITSLDSDDILMSNPSISFNYNNENNEMKQQTVKGHADNVILVNDICNLNNMLPNMSFNEFMNL